MRSTPLSGSNDRGGSRDGDKPVDSVDKSTSEEPDSSSPTPPGGPQTLPRGPQTLSGERSGADIARAALAAARAGRRTPAPRPVVARRRRGWSGPRPDNRDPQPLGALASRLVAERGWTEHVAAGVVFARWAALVGAEVAEHAQPVSLTQGELIVRASSTAWATQLRLLQRQLLTRITAGVGPGVVTALRVQGPAAPTWVHGPRHIRGRGPRDTYG